jgi:hypothetical protein
MKSQPLDAKKKNFSLQGVVVKEGMPKRLDAAKP